MGRVTGQTQNFLNSGGAWTPVVNLPYPLRGIYGHNLNDIMVVGDNTTNGHHFDGTNWNVAMYNLGDFANGVFFGSMYWYVVGNSGKGARTMTPEGTWTLYTVAASSNLRAVNGQPGSDQFPLAVGDNGTVQYFHPTGVWQTLGYPGGAADLFSGVFTP